MRLSARVAEASMRVGARGARNAEESVRLSAGARDTPRNYEVEGAKRGRSLDIYAFEHAKRARRP